MIKLKLVAVFLSLFLIGTANLTVQAQLNVLKFYNVELLVKRNAPVAVYAIRKTAVGDYLKKLNLIYLEQALTLNTIKPHRAIIDGRQFVFLTATYQENTKNRINPCFKNIKKSFWILEYKYHSLQPAHQELLTSCVKKIEVASDATGNDQISWNPKRYEFKINYAKHYLINQNDNKTTNNNQTKSATSAAAPATSNNQSAQNELIASSTTTASNNQSAVRADANTTMQDQPATGGDATQNAISVGGNLADTPTSTNAPTDTNIPTKGSQNVNPKPDDKKTANNKKLTASLRYDLSLKRFIFKIDK